MRIGGQTTRGTVRYSNDRSNSRQKPCKAKDVLVRVPNHPLTIVLETRTKGVLLIASIVHFISSIYEKSIRSLCHYYVGLKRQFTYYPIVICLVHVVFVGCLFFSGGTLNSNSKHACCRVSMWSHGHQNMALRCCFHLPTGWLFEGELFKLQRCRRRWWW